MTVFNIDTHRPTYLVSSMSAGCDEHGPDVHLYTFCPTSHLLWRIEMKAITRIILTLLRHLGIKHRHTF